MDHGSYMLITKGMPVIGDDGQIGIVNTVIADINLDVFRGIIVAHGILGKHIFISADVISGVTESNVEVNLSHSEFEKLPSEAPTATSSTGKFTS